MKGKFFFFCWTIFKLFSFLHFFHQANILLWRVLSKLYFWSYCGQSKQTEMQFFSSWKSWDQKYFARQLKWKSPPLETNHHEWCRLPLELSSFALIAWRQNNPFFNWAYVSLFCPRRYSSASIFYRQVCAIMTDGMHHPAGLLKDTQLEGQWKTERRRKKPRTSMK